MSLKLSEIPEVDDEFEDAGATRDETLADSRENLVLLCFETCIEPLGRDCEGVEVAGGTVGKPGRNEDVHNHLGGRSRSRAMVNLLMR